MEPPPAQLVLSGRALLGAVIVLPLAVFGITNEVGPDAHLQWLTHREQAQSTAREAVQALLQES